jgi:hypothetical protein
MFELGQAVDAEKRRFTGKKTKNPVDLVNPVKDIEILSKI